MMIINRINQKLTLPRNVFFVVLSMLTVCFLSASSYANIAGKTILAKGDVLAKAEDGKEIRSLKRRSVIYDIDQITTGAQSKAQFNMADGGLITLKENSKILITDYQYDGNSEKGSATLELVNGGLRSISGLIKEKGGDYKVKTPVGSIGIRGTHFVVQVDGDNVLFGVYSGNIDVTLGESEQVISLGETEDFSFAQIDISGQVTQMIAAPTALSIGFVNDSVESVNGVSAQSEEQAQVSTLTDNNDNSTFDAALYSEENLQAISDESIADLISQRVGSINYNQVTQSLINSSVGETSDFQMNMTIDFDNASVPGGSLSFSDQQGEWFASFSGLINIDQLELGVNFASHGNNKAQGNISAAFANGLDEVLGRFNLSEINDPTVNADGTFNIQP